MTPALREPQASINFMKGGTDMDFSFNMRRWVLALAGMTGLLGLMLATPVRAVQQVTATLAEPMTLSATVQTGGVVQLNWSPNSEADLDGYTIYRAVSAGGPFVALNPSLLTATSYLDAEIPPGAAQVWYQVSASDISGNESARSSVASVTLAGEPGAAAWSIGPCFPNPSGRGTSVRIPLVIPSGGGGARVEIVNSVGQRVRRLEIGPLAPGPAELQWDGRNEAGRETAPGAYTAWLLAGQTRVGARVVRVP